MRNLIPLALLAWLGGTCFGASAEFGAWHLVQGDADHLTADVVDGESRFTFSPAEAPGAVQLEAQVSGDFVVTVRMNEPERLRGRLRVELGTVQGFAIDAGRDGARLHGLRLMRSGGILGRQFSLDGLQWEYFQNSSAWHELPDTLPVTLRLESTGPLDPVAFTLTVQRPDELNVRTSWVGNSFPDRTRAVPATMGAIHATPDGALHTTGHFNESTSSFKIYSETGDYAGQHDVRGRGAHSGGWAITGDGTRVYFTSNGHRRFYANHHDGASTGLEAEIPAGALILGLALHDGILYASDAMGDRILRYRADTLTPDGEIAIPSPGPIAIDRAGRLWVLHNERTHAMRMVESRLKRELDRFPLPVVAAYNLDGSPLPQRIEGLDDPSALHYHAAADRLLVAENGPAQQVFAYGNLDVVPTLVETIGETGGIFAPPAGKVRPGHLNGVQAIASAGRDAVYVVNAGKRPAFGSWHHADLRRFVRDPASGRWQEAWSLVGNHFVDMGRVDPQTGDILSMFEVYAMDHDAPAGQGWTYAAYTHDPFAFPHDPRLWERMYRVLGVVRRDGRKLLYLGSDHNHFLAVYRFDEERRGAIAIPAALFATRALPDGKWGHQGPQPVEAGSGQPWCWRDADGDGQMSAPEFNVLPETHAVASWTVASNGDIWQPSATGLLVHRLRGFDAQGLPRFESVTEMEPYPAPIISYWRNTGVSAQYDAERDVLTVAGNTDDRRGFQGMFPRELVRYDHWSDPARRRLVSRIVLPHDNEAWPGPGERTRNLGGLHAAGDYVFAGSLKPSVFWVYDSRTGTLVDTFSPGPEIGGEMGDMDRGAVSLSAHKLSHNQYVVVAEEDFFLKLALFYWRPPAQPTPPERLSAPVVDAQPTAEGMTLWWRMEGKAVVDGYWVDRIDEAGARLRLTPEPIQGNVFTDAAAPLDAFHAYIVTPVSAGHTGPASAPRAGSRSTARATFRDLDDTTGGAWSGVYGTGGRFLFPEGQLALTLERGNLPGSTFQESVRSFFEGPLPAGRALAASIPESVRLALPDTAPPRRQDWGWRQTGLSQVSLRLATLDHRARALSLYLLANRSPSQVEIIFRDADDDRELDRREIELAGGGSGIYATWEVIGNLRIEVRHVAGEPVLCGLFLDPASEPPAERE